MVNLMEQAMSDIPQVKDKKKEQQAEDDLVVPHWQPEFYFNVIYDQSVYDLQGTMPSEVAAKLRIDWTVYAYQPIIWISDFWNLKKHMVPLNSTLAGSDLNLTLNFQLLGSYWF